MAVINIFSKNMNEMLSYSGNNITIKNNKVYINGNLQDDADTEGIYGITVEGNINELKTDLSVQVNGSVNNINAGGSVTSGAVNGNINAGGSVRCDNVGGHILAGGSVTRR